MYLCMRTGEFAKRLGISETTVYNWRRFGKLIPSGKTPGNQYIYTEEDVLKAMSIKVIELPRKCVVYARVSTNGQKEDLKRQIESLRFFCQNKGITIDELLEDIGSGLNYKRKNFIKLMEMIDKKEVKTLIIAYKDRLVRFGYEWFEHWTTTKGTQIIYMDESLKTPNEELTEDLISIIQHFAAKLYGSRSYKSKIQKIKEVLDDPN